MKKIRLAVAQRYLRRYNDTGAQIECAYSEGKPLNETFTLRFL